MINNEITYLSSLIVLASVLSLISGFGSQSSSQSLQQALQKPSPHPGLAKSILQKSGDKYAAVSSYQDSGTVEVTSNGEQKPTKRVHFKTYFMRPDLFRFEWIDDSTGELTNNIIWLNGKEVSVYQAPNVLKRGEALGLVAATVQSEGAAQSIPRLLTHVGGFALTELDELSLEREEQFDGAPCYVIKGKHQVPTTTYAPYPKVQSTGKEELATIELWIDKTDYVIRKIRTTITIDSTVQEEIHRDIKLDEKIPNANFEPKIPTPR
jgi:outer membrane lipoprotein-sorting protein